MERFSGEIASEWSRPTSSVLIAHQGSSTGAAHRRIIRTKIEKRMGSIETLGSHSFESTARPLFVILGRLFLLEKLSAIKENLTITNFLAGVLVSRRGAQYRSARSYGTGGL
jgi:hypothetical protein